VARSLDEYIEKPLKSLSVVLLKKYSPCK
jgi:hypothetical protein